MAFTYSIEHGWGSEPDIEIPMIKAPPGYVTCNVVYGESALDEPGNMAYFKRETPDSAAYEYLLQIRDLDGSLRQILVTDFPSLLAFFQASFAFSFQHAFEQNIERLAELLENRPTSRDD